MPKGAKPGIRQGGRQRGTPNRATILRDRILALVAARPSLSARELFRLLTRDAELAADTRLKLIEFGKRPPREMKRLFKMIDPLLRIVDDWQGVPRHCQNTATKMAKILLPKTPSRPEWRYKTGRYGFCYSNALAKKYRDLHLRSHGYFSSKREKQLEALLARRSPPPELYGVHQIGDDRRRIDFFADKRMRGLPLSELDDDEEAECLARLVTFEYDPHRFARGRREELVRKERRDGGLSLKDKAELSYLRTFFPDIHLYEPIPKSADAITAEGFAFKSATPGPDGFFRASDQSPQAPNNVSLQSSASACSRPADK